ncbi:hypothetical protein BDR26DRAFT_935445 [Obelidium mucronatum]|nr:hypothetical protein BDR26DRAFT_935442 [Obelidium mucronatum]KAI9338009.1 hypothetical protein BDR26DRAFT_935445 [Obelidium mucronatum]
MEGASNHLRAIDVLRSVLSLPDPPYLVKQREYGIMVAQLFPFANESDTGEAFVRPDGKTMIEDTLDLSEAVAMYPNSKEKPWTLPMDDIEASEDPLQQARVAYLMELSKDTFIDGFGEDSGVLRFINNAPNASLVNCRFAVDRVKKTVSVETIPKVAAGCEFFLVYRFNSNGNGVYWNQIHSDSAERLAQRKQIIAAMKHVDL